MNNDRNGWLSISYGKWIKACVDEDTYAFAIEVKDGKRSDSLLGAVEDTFRRLYPDVRLIKQFPLIEDNKCIAYIIKCRTPKYTITARDIAIILKREITREDIFRITRVQDYRADPKSRVFAIPTGNPAMLQSSF